MFKRVDTGDGANKKNEVCDIRLVPPVMLNMMGRWVNLIRLHVHVHHNQIRPSSPVLLFKKTYQSRDGERLPTNIRWGEWWLNVSIPRIYRRMAWLIWRHGTCSQANMLVIGYFFLPSWCGVALSSVEESQISSLDCCCSVSESFSSSLCLRLWPACAISPSHHRIVC